MQNASSSSPKVMSPTTIVAQLRLAASEQEVLARRFDSHDVTETDIRTDHSSLKCGMSAILAAREAGLIEHLAELKEFWASYDIQHASCIGHGGYSALPFAANTYFQSPMSFSPTDEEYGDRLDAVACNRIARFLGEVAEWIETNHDQPIVLVERLGAFICHADRWFEAYTRRQKDIALGRVDPKNIDDPSFKQSQHALNFMRYAMSAALDLARDIAKIDAKIDVLCLHRFAAAGKSMMKDLDNTWFLGWKGKFANLNEELERQTALTRTDTKTTGQSGDDATNSTPRRRELQSRRHGKGEAQEKIIGGLTLHHEYSPAGKNAERVSVGNSDPICVQKFAAKIGVGSSTVSDFLARWWPPSNGVTAYRVYSNVCHDPGRLGLTIAAMNRDLVPERQRTNANLANRSDAE